MPSFFSGYFNTFRFTGELLGWVFYYNSRSSRSDFIVDIWRPVGHGVGDLQYTLVNSTRITPKQDATVEVIGIRKIALPSTTMLLEGCTCI